MVHIATIQCLRGDVAPQDAYQASKAGVTALSKSLAVQLAGDRIRSNVIHPGPTLSPMQQRWYDDPQAAVRVAGEIPLGRLGMPEDIARATLFLLSDEASYITGTDLIVDGGSHGPSLSTLPRQRPASAARIGQCELESRNDPRSMSSAPEAVVRTARNGSGETRRYAVALAVPALRRWSQ